MTPDGVTLPDWVSRCHAIGGGRRPPIRNGQGRRRRQSEVERMVETGTGSGWEVL
jgi:hypothetical protein